MPVVRTTPHNPNPPAEAMAAPKPLVKAPVRPPVRAVGGVLSRIVPVGFDEAEGIKVLIYGRSGSGKTTFTGTFPKPILFLQMSGGSRPGEARSIDTPEIRATCKKVAPRNSSELETLIKHVGMGAYKTLVVDHGSGMQDLVLAEVLQLMKLPEQKHWGMASQQDYGECTRICKELFRKMLDLPINVAIIAQEREFTSEAPADMAIMPSIGAAMTPSLVSWLNPAVDYIVQTHIRAKYEREIITKGGKRVYSGNLVKTKDVEWCLRTAPHEIFQTKFRMPKGAKLPEVIVDPNYDKLMQLIRGGGLPAGTTA